MNRLPIYESMLAKPVEFWLDLSCELFTDNCAVVIGKPDPETAERVEREEKARLEQLKSNTSIFAQAIDTIKNLAKKIKLEVLPNKCDVTVREQIFFHLYAIYSIFRNVQILRFSIILKSTSVKAASMLRRKFSPLMSSARMAIAQSRCRNSAIFRLQQFCTRSIRSLYA